MPYSLRPPLTGAAWSISSGATNVKILNRNNFRIVHFPFSLVCADLFRLCPETGRFSLQLPPVEDASLIRPDCRASDDVDSFAPLIGATVIVDGLEVVVVIVGVETH